MEPTFGMQGAKIALLIDFDNVVLGVEEPGFDVELVVNALRSRGIVVMGRAYGDWYRHHRHRRKLMEQGIELVETPVFGPVIKNSADIRIVLDGIDVALAHSHIDTFCLVSGDSDFLPLIKRLQLLGKNVIVIAGQKFTSELVRRNCNEYIAYENLFAESIGATEDVSTLEGACQLLQRAIDTITERGVDARSSTVKQMMLQLNPAFSERTFGCSQFKQFLDKAARQGAVKMGERDTHTGEFTVLLRENGEAPFRDTTPRENAARDNAPRENASRQNASRESAPRENGNRETAQRETPREKTARPTASDEKRESAHAHPISGVRRRTHADKTSLSTQGEAPTTTANAETAHLPIEDQMLAESGITFRTTEKLQARAGLRRGRLRFSAKSGVARIENEIPGVVTAQEEIAIAEAIEEVENAVIAIDATPSQEEVELAQIEPIAQGERLVQGETDSSGAPNIEGALPEYSAAPPTPESADEKPAEPTEPAAPKKRTTRGGRGRKPKSETAKNASAEKAPDTSENADALLPAAPDSAPAPADATPESPEPVAEPTTPAEATEAEAPTAEAPAPKKRTTRGGRRRKPKEAASEEAPQAEAPETEAPAESGE